MVDKVKPLKIEDNTNGSSLNFAPKEANPDEDFLAAKGIAFENSDDTTIRGDSGVMKFKDSVVTTEVTLQDLLGTSNDYAIFSIWAEESAGLTDAAKEWSFGNGAAGENGIVLPVDAELFAVSYNTNNAGTNTEVSVLLNNTTQIGTTGLQSGQDGFNTLSSAVSVSAGDRIGFQTVTGGGASNARVCAWFRVPITTLLDVGLNDLNDVVLTSTASGQFLQYNGTNWVNITIDADDIDDTSTTNKFATQAELDQIATNQSNISTNASNISTNASNISTNAASITTNAAGITTNASGISNNATGITNNASNITTNASNISTNTASITTNTASITTNTASITTNTASITTNAAGITTNASNISTNAAGITTNASNLTTHVNDTSNPHNTTFTQAVAADSGTDITAAEAEELTDGSTTSLHDHRELVDETGTNRVEVLNGGDVQLSNYPQTRNNTTSNDEKVLTTDGSGNLVLRRVLPFYDSVKKISNSTTEAGVNQTTTFETYLELTTTIPETGNYDIDWRYVWSLNDGSEDFRVRILLDGSAISTYNEHRQEPKDTAGSGVVLLTTSGTTQNTGTNQRFRLSDFEPEVNLTAGSHTITIQWSGTAANDRAAIYEGSIRIKRVS